MKEGKLISTTVDRKPIRVYQAEDGRLYALTWMTDIKIVSKKYYDTVEELHEDVKNEKIEWVTERDKMKQKEEEMSEMEKKILESIWNMQGKGEADSETKIDGYCFRAKRPRTKKCKKTIREFAKIAEQDRDIEAVLVHGKCFYFRY